MTTISRKVTRALVLPLDGTFCADSGKVLAVRLAPGSDSNAILMKIKTLIRQARLAAKSRGHDLYRFTVVKDIAWLANSTCRNCGMYVGVNAKPAPNEINIGGEAVALNCPNCPKARLEYLRSQLRAENISYGELHELQCLSKYIKADDIELRQAAGIPETQS